MNGTIRLAVETTDEAQLLTLRQLLHEAASTCCTVRASSAYMGDYAFSESPSATCDAEVRA